MTQLTGTGVALVTPFKKDLSIDFEALGKLVEHNISNGTNYLVVLGTTAESATLSTEEKNLVIRHIKAVNAGRLPMVLGIGGNNTKNVIQQIQNSDLSDFQAILSVSPYYNKPTQDGIYQHYKAIATQTKAPIIVYNVPSRTGSNIDSATTLRLANDFENIIAIKEASPNFLQSTEIIKDKPEKFHVISGDDEYTLPMTLAGGSGVISVLAQALPEVFSTMVNLGLERKVDEAYPIHYQINTVTRLIYEEGNPAGIKALLHILGICEPHTRLPLISASTELHQKLEKAVKNLIHSN